MKEDALASTVELISESLQNPSTERDPLSASKNDDMDMLDADEGDELEIASAVSGEDEAME
eukprot:6386840-Pyramimonas_sp.AAC.1